MFFRGQDVTLVCSKECEEGRGSRTRILLESRSVMTRLSNATGTISQAPAAFEDDSLLGPSYKPVSQELACHY